MKITKKASGPKELWNEMLKNNKTKKFIKKTWSHNKEESKENIKKFKKIIKDIKRKISK